MSRRARGKSTGTQLFAFLDVMIGTMGALVVLLHAFARHEHAQVTKTVAAKTQAMEVSVEDFRWRTKEIREARGKTEAQLADERLKLAHVEDHQRRLLEKLEQLKLSVAEMERAGAEKTETRERTAAELAAAKAELEQAKTALEAARGQGGEKRTSYSVVPYHGPNATDRRPIYIECREDLIILQPEGIELTPRDFVGNFTPGNPLAAALRAQREYYARQAPGGKLAQEPYPLLLVRPEGIAAYYAARAALDSWGNDFGYELIGSDWTLKFPSPDPDLTRLTRKVVGEARLRHREYTMTSPQAARRRSRPVYHARSHGGFTTDGGAGGLYGPRGGKGGWDDYAGNWATGGGDDGPGTNPHGSPGDRAALREPYGSPRDSGTLQDPYGSPAGSAAMQDPYGNAGKSAADDGKHGGSRFGGRHPEADDTAGSPGDTENRGQAQTQSGGSRHGTTDKDGGGSASPSLANSAPGAEPQEAQGAFGAPDPSGAQAQIGAGGTPSAHAPSGRAQTPRSLASTRGHDWGLPDSGVGAVAATRPILVACYPDRLVVVPEASGQRAKEIRLSAQTRDSMDELVSAVWEHMKDWGKAGKGLYWRPTLTMDVKPGAEGRYAEIQSLMADSGLDVTPRQPPAAAGARASRPLRQPTRKR